jgi:hypothetical protein
MATRRAPPLRAAHCAYTPPPPAPASAPPQGLGQKLAGWEHACRLCEALVRKGEAIWPVRKPEGKSINPGGIRATEFSWCHVACARAHGGEAGLAGLERMACPFFARAGACAHGDACFYSHDAAPGGAAAATSAAGGDPPKKSGTWRRRRVRNNCKVGCLRRWLLDEFGVALLSEGGGVLDIAGGKGELAFELENLNRVPVTVVDPRPLNLGKFRRKLAAGLYWRNPLMHAHIDAGVTPETAPRAPRHLRCLFDAPLLAALPLAARPARCDGVCLAGLRRSLRLGRGSSCSCRACAALDREMDEDEEDGGGGRGDDGAPAPAQEEEGAGGGSEAAAAWAAAFAAAQERGGVLSWTRKGLVGKAQAAEAGVAYASEEQAEAAAAAAAKAVTAASTGGGGGAGRAGGASAGGASALLVPEQEGEEESEGHVLGAPHEALAALLGCSVVVGMHPDQAVGPLLAFAIAARKPFACVPCCVYSRDFGRRRLPGADPGVQVRSYEQLVAHLRSLHPGVRVLDLDFEGKNKLLYWRPDNDSDPGLGDC